LQIFTKFLNIEGFRLENFVRFVRLSELMWKQVHQNTQAGCYLQQLQR